MEAARGPRLHGRSNYPPGEACRVQRPAGAPGGLRGAAALPLRDGVSALEVESRAHSHTHRSRHLNAKYHRTDRSCLLRGRYLAKFWCTLAWIEQYWNDAKAWTRKLCDYTVPKLKADFPVALDTAAQSPRSALWTTSRPCARSGATVTSGASMASSSSTRGRRALPPGACTAGQTHLTRWCLCEIPSHRRAQLIKMNLASDPQVRSRSN